MKQTLFMVVVTVIGAVGPFIEPAVGVMIYYLFAVLRPHYMWDWALPRGVPWSQIVALATIAGALLHSSLIGRAEMGIRRFSVPHLLVVVFGAWVSLSYFTAIDTDVAYPWLLEYLKIFVMFAVATATLYSLRQLRLLLMLTALAIGYIAYEINFKYVVDGYLGVYHTGYGGLDNNGAGLMLAMGVPLCFAVWDMERRWWRWWFIGLIPPIVHAVLLTYSRGAMVSLIAAAPLIALRSRRRWQMTMAGALVLLLIPLLAGQEIRERFFSIEQYEEDRSAQSRFDSWAAGIAIAADHPMLGAGIRNSQLLTFDYGADIRGRAIHSQYVQVAADSGFPALFLYLASLAAIWLVVRRVRRATKGGTSDEDRWAAGIAIGVETGMAVFCTGAVFLSLEVFELPWLLLLLGAQVGTLYRRKPAEVAVPGPLNPRVRSPNALWGPPAGRAPVAGVR